MQLSNILLVTFVAFTTLVAARPSSEKGNGLRLIKTSEDLPGEWLSQEEIFSLISKHVGFMDITNRKVPAIKRTSHGTKGFPTALNFNASVQAAIARLDSSRIESFVTDFSSFYNRYYNGEFGVEAATWLREQVASVITSNLATYNGSVQVGTFYHAGWLQPSTIARIGGSEPGLVIIGSHMDSIQSGNSSGAAPGADDNASGSSALLEVFRALLESGFVPKKAIEFHWYAGEELGLLGSQAIAEEYFLNKANVTSMLNFDCVGYKSNLTNLRFRTDYGDPELTKFLQLATEGYLKKNWTTSECGYACSDHASWDSFGFSSASPAEPISSPNMHTTKDSLETVDFEMIKEYSKLATAYLIEVAEPRN